MEKLHTVLTWTRYDGTTETLPEKDTPVLLAKALNYGDTFYYIEGAGWSSLNLKVGYVPECMLLIGDFWAYLPEPPQGVE